uniref:Cystatin-8 n=1 Tax=Microcebus murinus TaxID=30608 RepID=A0A8B7EK57_MICMU|nr:cystatin-8 [Microcebus murinus]XP_012594648.1 cystatin-8 [Microcebus murinus]
MSRPWWLSLFLLTLPMGLVASTDPGKNELTMELRTFKTINTTSSNVKQCLWFAMQEYNKESEDKYIFMVTRVLRAQLRVTYCLEYIIDVEIVRSNCKKISSNNENCAIQRNSKLEKRVSCTFFMEALPWNGEFNLIEKECKDV